MGINHIQREDHADNFMSKMQKHKKKKLEHLTHIYQSTCDTHSSSSQHVPTSGLNPEYLYRLQSVMCGQLVGIRGGRGCNLAAALLPLAAITCWPASCWHLMNPGSTSQTSWCAHYPMYLTHRSSSQDYCTFKVIYSSDCIVKSVPKGIVLVAIAQQFISNSPSCVYLNHVF